MPSKIPKKYVPDSLSKSDRKKQIESIKKGTDRPRVKYNKIKSIWTEKANKYFKNDTSIDNIVKKLKLKNKRGLMKIILKGYAAYYTSGSRPNTKPYQWGLVRLYSVLFGGPARQIDIDIVDKYKLPLIKVQ